MVATCWRTGIARGRCQRVATAYPAPRVVRVSLMSSTSYVEGDSGASARTGPGHMQTYRGPLDGVDPTLR